MSFHPALRNVLAAGLMGAATLSLGACAEDRGPGVYSPYEEGYMAHVWEGTVVGARPIEFGPGDTTGGTVVGGVGGAVVGSAVAGRGDRGAGAVLGAIGGALIGNAIASSNRTHGFAYTIRRGDGRLVEVAQADPQPFPEGSRVSVSYGPGHRARVSPLYGPPDGGGGYPPPPPPPPPPR
jgi:outer membrane lipoprotein SlyB